MLRRANCLKSGIRVAVGILCLYLLAGRVVAAQEPKTRIRISYPTASICCVALFAAQQWKIFEENGLEVESIQMRSQAANAALVSGDIHYVAGVGPSSVVATLRGLPSKAVWFASDQLIYSLMARPEIKSLKELRGKRISIDTLSARISAPLLLTGSSG